MKDFAKMNYLASFVTLIVLVTLVPEVVHARPAGGIISRHKRVSDQRLAELQTLLALAAMRGKLVTVPLGFGRVDPAKIGRRRRSSVEYDLQKLRRMLQAVARDSESVSEENSEGLPSSWINNDHDETEDQLI